ncbi:MAG TPA: hypothetical protein VGG53_17690 [Mycobacterium sp.]|jgi:hypothetical protein|uniref:hypothetical protein n=1 Tax=Mycobacterium sp. TaxID=1785 RepID=UPI002F3EEED9
MQKPTLQRPKQAMYFVEASLYLRQIVKPGETVGVGSLIRGSPDVVRKLLQFGALGL